MLAALGAKVVLGARREDRLEALVSKIKTAVCWINMDFYHVNLNLRVTDGVKSGFYEGYFYTIS